MDARESNHSSKEMLESLVQSASGMGKKGTDQLIRVAHQSQIAQGSF